MRTLLRVQGTSHSCKTVRLGLHFDEDGTLLNPLRVARSSLVGWGPWQTQHRVETRWGPAWYVSTAGHGGYILVTQTRVVPEAFGAPVFAVDHEGKRVFVHEFEEDCAWAVLEYLDAGVREWSRTKQYKTVRSPEEYLEGVKKTLREWGPECLKKELA